MASANPRLTSGAPPGAPPRTPGAGRTPPSVIHPPTAPADDGDSAAPEAPGALASVASVASVPSVARGAGVGSEAPTGAGGAAGGGGASVSTAGDFAFEPSAGAGSRSGDGSAVPSEGDGAGAERAATIGRRACAPPRPVGEAAGWPAPAPATWDRTSSVRSMKSAPGSVSPLTASSTARRRPAWRASEALSVTSRRRGVIVATPARPTQIVGGLREVHGASL